jgi:gamma-glutamyl hercynylcysteine S-oxide synthase
MDGSRVIGLALFVTGVAMLTMTSLAAESLIPNEMVYVAQGPSVMGIDKEQPADSGKKLTAYDRRMNTPGRPML